ncbi:unnamed protein product [Plutella xylostella]|uniref:(diamondback moth) hypothetical protein n=1 Tax=Plutella xylostella TaxID=51655 RepID=A0A8S4DTT1_PLUXY|nr:unnamed protein product [Plutella xylostella]
MCIIFAYLGSHDQDSDYSLVLASNRDENYDRPALNAAPWTEDPTIIGGRDMAEGCGNGSWMAISPQRKILGLLLNLPGNQKEHAKSRGKIVEDLVKHDWGSVEQYVDSIKAYSKTTNDFALISADFSKPEPMIQAFNNVTNNLETCNSTYLGFGNSLPDVPLKKVEAGKERLRNICPRLCKISKKDELIDELITLLRWDQRHLPDAELQRRNPKSYELLSSVFVSIPAFRYGTRTHSIVLVSKSGHTDFIELTMQPPIDPSQPQWTRTDFHFEP